MYKVERSGKRGRPRKNISASWLTDAVQGKRRITFTKLAELVGVHRHTLRAYLKRYNVYHRFCQISTEDLDLLVRLYKLHKPASGLRYVVGFMRSHGLRIQRKRVRDSMRRVDGLGQVLRNHAAINRQKYSVPHSNYLWHLDGHHKLIKWGFVIHGIVDGYCHTVCAVCTCPSDPDELTISCT